MQICNCILSGSGQSSRHSILLSPSMLKSRSCQHIQNLHIIVESPLAKSGLILCPKSKTCRKPPALENIPPRILYGLPATVRPIPPISHLRASSYNYSFSMYIYVLSDNYLNCQLYTSSPGNRKFTRVNSNNFSTRQWNLFPEKSLESRKQKSGKSDREQSQSRWKVEKSKVAKIFTRQLQINKRLRTALKSFLRRFCVIVLYLYPKAIKMRQNAK